MGNHTITVHQLKSDTGKSFLNVIDNECGQISVWGSCYENYVYLIQDDYTFYLRVFDDKEFAQEWLEENSGKYFKITKLKEVS